MSKSEIPLAHAVLHEPLFLPSLTTGKGINLKNTISPGNTEGKSMGLKLTLLDNFVLIETNAASGLIPFSNFKLLVPAK